MAHTPELTRNQKFVLDALVGSKSPMSAYGLLDALRGEGLRGPPQVYRALDKLIEFGLAHRLETMNAFVACAHQHDHEGCGATAFAICNECGVVEEFCDRRITEQLSGWASDNAFRARHTTIEIRGVCRACAN